MKRLLVCLLLVGMLLTALVGCGGPAAEENQGPTNDNDKALMGMAIKATADAEDAEASFTTLAAVVLIDESGKILSCRLDELQLKPTVEDGKLKDVTDFRTKYEMGEAYNMKQAGAKQEWYAQVDAFCKYVVGKTADEVAGIELKDNKATDPDLTAGCTIMVNDFMVVVSDAAKAAKACDATASDKLGLAITATRYAESEDTEPRYDISVSAAAVNAEGKITGCRADELQKAFTIENGAFSTESGAVPTKGQQKEDYNMKTASSIGLEWYEQVANLEAYLVGKNAADMGSISLTDGKATDLSSGCTIVVSDMLKNMQKAANAAK